MRNSSSSHAIAAEPAILPIQPSQAAGGIRRAAGIAFGVATHGLFAFTVWHLFHFLNGRYAAQNGSLWWDAFLSLQFVVVHSLLLHPTTRRHLGRWIGREFYGLFFCVATCVGLLGTFAAWRSSDVVVWELESWGKSAMVALFATSWVLLFYSLHLSGLGWQTGLTPWWQWVRKQPLPRREFKERGLYRYFRHPIYLSFLGLIWFTPVMTLDHALLTGFWTVYIFAGSWLKDLRLEFYMGDTYREYESRVPGYPLLRRGPLGLKPLRNDAVLKLDRPSETLTQRSKAA